MKDQIYKAVAIKEGNSTEPIQYVGVYTLNWQKEWGEPEIGFAEQEAIEPRPVLTEEELEKLAHKYAYKKQRGEFMKPAKRERIKANFIAGYKASLSTPGQEEAKEEEVRKRKEAQLQKEQECEEHHYLPSGGKWSPIGQMTCQFCVKTIE